MPVILLQPSNRGGENHEDANASAVTSSPIGLDSFRLSQHRHPEPLFVLDQLPCSAGYYCYAINITGSMWTGDFGVYVAALGSPGYSTGSIVQTLGDAVQANTT